VPAHGADERRDGARLVVVRLGDHGGDVERLCADQKVPA